MEAIYRRMKYIKSTFIALALVLITWFCLFAVGAYRIRGENYVLGNNISTLIIENLETHDSKSDVLAFLDVHKLHDYSQSAGDAVNENSLEKELGQNLHGIASAITVPIFDVESSLLSRYFVIVVFYFDKHDEMIAFKTRKMGIGL